MLFASTVEELDTLLNDFLEKSNICIGNYTDLKLWKNGSIYQLALVYAEVI
jgi:hypothetical protein